MNFCVLGAGAWGTAIAVHLVRLGHNVTLAPRRFEQALEISSRRFNVEHLPGVELPRSLQIGFELAPALMEGDVVLIASPMVGLGEWAARVREELDRSNSIRLFITLTKGLDPETFLLPSEIIARALPQYQHAALSGPSNALQVAREKPTAITLAGTDGLIEKVQKAMSCPTMRVYASSDVKGVELGGCLKNIYAIAAGCLDALGLGDNAKAALLTRSLAEMVRVGGALGARVETFYGLSGFGDLVATAYGGWSRNRGFGEGIGLGKSVEELMRDRKSVVEGYSTTDAFYHLCRKKGIDAPILTEVYRLIFEGKKPAAALNDLMLRDLKAENPQSRDNERPAKL